MRKCDDCRIALGDDVRFCPKCGKPLEDGLEPFDPNRTEVRVLMTSANLHRVRREWEEAINDATEAMRLDPQNPEIPSLLAVVYEQRGMLEEAAVWYRAALDLDPNRAGDKTRLDNINSKLSSSNANAANSRFDKKIIWLGAASAVIVVVLALIFVLTLRGGNPKEQIIEPGPAPAASSVPGVDVGIKNRPLPTGPASDVPRTSESLAGDGSANSNPQASQARTAAESEIRKEISESESVGASGASIDDVIADPRQGVVTVTFTIPATGNITREAILRAATAIAGETFGAHEGVNYVTTRCVVAPSGESRAQVAFIGDISREAMQNISPSATNEQFERAFTSEWWNPQVR